MQYNLSLSMSDKNQTINEPYNICDLNDGQKTILYSALSSTALGLGLGLGLLEQRPEKIQALSGIRTHHLCGAGAVLNQ